MSLDRLNRIPKRLVDDLKVLRLAKNCAEVFAAKLGNRDLSRIELRSGVVLNAPDQIALNFLFHEIWIDEFYAPTGYGIGANETVVDIGGNIGVFALWAATRAPNTRVLSFEPFPKNIEFFEMNVMESRIENVQIYPWAVGKKDELRRLGVSDSWILHSLNDSEDKEEDGSIEVECKSLDTIFNEVNSCGLLKLDCEGGEYEALYSASRETLGKIDRLVCEFNVIDNDKQNGPALSKYLESFGFRIDRFEHLDETCGFICGRRV